MAPKRMVFSGGEKAFKKDSFAQNRKELNWSFMTQRMYTLESETMPVREWDATRMV